MRNTLPLTHLDIWGKDYPDQWHGRWIVHGGVSDADFTAGDVAEVIASATTPDAWDGFSAAVLRLTDGRFVSFESFYGPTGSGFCDDAYGGDADIHVAPDFDTIVRFGLTDEGRALLEIDSPNPTERISP